MTAYMMFRFILPPAKPSKEGTRDTPFPDEIQIESGPPSPGACHEQIVHSSVGNRAGRHRGPRRAGPRGSAAGTGPRRTGPALQGLARLRTAAVREWRARLHRRDIRAPPPGTGEVPRAPRRDRHPGLAGRAAGRSRAGARRDERARFLYPRTAALGAGSRLLHDDLE